MDEAAFRELTAPYLRELRVHCYRVLGSLDDADDLVQETLLAAWRGFDGFAGRSSLRAWLYRIATNRCLNAIRDGKRRPLAPAPPFEPPAPNGTVEVPWLQPYPDDPADEYQSRETVELAFVTALQLMPPRQTAALLLCDVLGFAVAEVAGMLDDTPTAIKGVLQRARAAVRAPGPPREHDAELAKRFADAFTNDYVRGVIDLLTDDAWLAMPPAPHEYHGPGAVAAFLTASATARAGRRFHLEPTRANAQPAFLCHYNEAPAGVLVLTMANERIAGITRFLDPGLHRHFRPQSR